MHTAEELIKNLQLVPHPEGGYYKEIHRAQLKLNCLATHNGERAAYTTIYFLLAYDDFSAWHKVASDETWYFHTGCDLILYTLDKCTQEVCSYALGLNAGVFQVTIKANTWFCARPTNANSYCLVSCSVGPGFDFKDFKLATEQELLEQFPGQLALIQEFIRHEPVVSVGA